MKKGIQIILVYIVIFMLIGLVLLLKTNNISSGKKVNLGAVSEVVVSIGDSISKSWENVKKSIKGTKLIDPEKIKKLLPKSCNLEKPFHCKADFSFYPESRSFILRIDYFGSSPVYIDRVLLENGIECKANEGFREVKTGNFFVEMVNCTLYKKYSDISIYYAKDKGESNLIHKSKGSLILS